MKNILFILLFYSTTLLGQSPSFTVEVSTDSLLMGNYMEVTFTLKEAAGKAFEAPTFEGFQVVGGPNHSSSFSVVNGDVSQELSYSYYLEPIDIGNYYIEPATIEVEGKVMESSPVEIIVHPNPDGIKQPLKKSNEYSIFGSPKPPPTQVPPKKTKKKRKIYKM